MEPAYLEGDLVLTFNWIKPKIRDVIIFKSSNKFLIKRVKKISGQKLSVEGDNKTSSSRVEPINQDLVVGRVVLKY